MKNATIKRRKEQIMYILLVLYTVFITDSMIFGLNSNSTIVNYAKNSIILFLILLLIYAFIKNIKLSTKELLITIIFVISLFASMIVTKDFTGAYFIKIALVIISLLFAKVIDVNKFIATYIRVIQYIAVFSLVAMILQNIIIQIAFLPEIITPRGHIFSSLGLTNLPHYNSYKLRNWGPFWEPGVYQAYLNLALFFVIHWSGKIRKKELYRIILFSLSIVSTLSTSGIIAMVFLLLSLIFKSNKDLRHTTKILIILIFAISSVYILSNNHLSTIIFGKLSVSSAGNLTLMSRWYSITGILKIFIDNPIFGAGPNNVLLELANYANQVTSVTNTITFHFASFGIISGLIYTWYTYKLINTSRGNIWITIPLVAWLSIILMSQNYTYSLFFNIIIFISCSNRIIELRGNA